MADARILVIEDESDLAELLAFNLRGAGYEVTTVRSGKEGLAQLSGHQLPDLIVLDLMLPDLPGTEVCRKLRADPRTKTIPVVMLTAKGEEIDRVVGFEVGADDYVVKPFSVRELMLRLRAILRRGEEARTPAASEPRERFGRLLVDRDAYRAWVDDVEVSLTALELKLLAHLMSVKGRVQSREHLLEAVWGYSPDLTTRTVDTHVKRLREKLGTAADYVETVRGVGYRFSDQP